MTRRRRRWPWRRRRHASPATETRTLLPPHGTWPADTAPPLAAAPPGPDELRVQALLLQFGVHPAGRHHS